MPRSGQSPATPESDSEERRDEPPARSKVDERKERTTTTTTTTTTAAPEEEERRRKERQDERRSEALGTSDLDEASRWRERRQKRQDSLGDDNQDAHDSLEKPDKTPGTALTLFVFLVSYHYLLLMCFFFCYRVGGTHCLYLLSVVISLYYLICLFRMESQW